MNELITVIVPVYNAEKNLSSCISSIIKQTYTNIEILFINDGSVDNSVDILKKYALLDNRIQVISQKNQGVSATRNLGIKLSKGEFLYFMDADDEIEPRVLDILYGAIKDESDLVMSNYKVGKSDDFKCNKIDRIGNLDKLTFLDNIDNYYLNSFLNAVWNKFFKKKIIEENKILFEENINMGEDLIFVLEYLKYCEKINIVNIEQHYRYLDNDNSLTKKVDVKYFSMYKIIYSKFEEYLRFEEYFNYQTFKVINRTYTMLNIGLIINFFGENAVNKRNVDEIYKLLDVRSMDIERLEFKSRLFLKAFLGKKILLIKAILSIYKIYSNIMRLTAKGH